MNRRKMIGSMAGAAVVTVTSPLNTVLRRDSNQPATLKGNIHHSVSQWCYSDIPLEDFARACKEMGIESVELLTEKDWAVVKNAGLKCAVGYATDWGIPRGFNRIENHEKLIADFETMIPKAAEAGVPNLICFSGNREGQDDNEGMINCAKGLRKLMPAAEKYGVTIIMELLNSYGHKDYQCDRTSWGSALCEMVGSVDSSFCMIFITCRLWKAILLIQLQNIASISDMFIPGVCLEEMKLMILRNLTILLL